jgi:kumamolisin
MADSNVDLFEGFLAPVNDNTRGVISSSIGPGCSQADLAYFQTMDQIFQQAAAQGQTVFEAAGDHGAATESLQVVNNQLVCSWVGDPSANTDYASAIAGSPNVTAVGGTQFTPSYNDGNDQSTQGSGNGGESVWNNGGDWAGAGGISAIFPLPSWQTAVQDQLQLTNNMRLLPDLIFGASSSAPGFYVYEDYQDGTGTHLNVDGGTSIATPMMAGISRLVAHAAGLTRLGNINPLRFKALADGSLIADQNPDADIFDITVGNNAVGYSSGYDALSGFDPASGWGSPNIGNFVPHFAKVIAGKSPTK